MWFNQADIETLAENHHDCPNVRKAVKLLHALMESVNEQSDGWPYWKAPAQAASQLMQLIQNAGKTWHGTVTGTISDADLKKAITPIRRFATVQEEKQKQYGNKFHFDVDAALQ